MSFLYAESLLELAIRIGIADLAANPEDVTALLGIDPGLNSGLDLTPPGGQPTFDQTLLDEFQNKIAELRRLKGEEGLRPVFRNNIPDLPDIQEYLRTANVRFAHGYPRETADLPMVCITLGGESEGNKYLGQHKYTPLRQRGDGSIVVRQGSDMESDYHIHILTPNYDETVILFHLLKYGLLKYRDHLEGYGIREATMHWQPCEPAPEYLQGGLFIYQRTCVLSCVKDESFEYARPGYTGLTYSVQADGDTIIERQVVPEGPEEGILP